MTGSTPQWARANVVPTVEGNENVVTLTPAATTFYRLARPVAPE